MKTHILTLAALFAFAAPALAAEVNVRDLAAHPERYVGHEIEIRTAYCGNAGDNPGYMCSTSGAAYISVAALVANAAKATIDANCGGLDWTEKSPFCRVRLKFTPTGFHADKDLDENGKAIVIEATQATAILSPN